MNPSVETSLLDATSPYASATYRELGGSVRTAAGSDELAIELTLGVPTAALQHELAGDARRVLTSAGIPRASVKVVQRIAVHAVQGELSPMTNVRNVIAVGSGKGGVGKSTVTANLAVALAAEGARVGILDADIYGPSIPTMLGVSARPDSPDGKSIEPLRAHGVQVMSIGLLVEQDTPMIWRGPMATSALTQLLNDTRWDNLDYLFIDLPPGTGDIQLTLAQKIPVAGAIIVTTPQDVATLDARKAVRMFEKVGVPILGLVENMALHTCARCGHEEHLFGSGGAARLSAEYGLPVLGSLPIDPVLRECADAGRPVMTSDLKPASFHPLISTARRAAVELAKRPTLRKALSVALQP